MALDPVVGVYTILSQIQNWTDPLAQVIGEDIGRIGWNTFLALVPLTLSFFLFCQPRSRWFLGSTYLVLSLSFIVGIKKYNDGNFLEVLKKIAISLWGIRSIFIALSICLIIILIAIDRRWRSSQNLQSQSSQAARSPALTHRNRSIFWWIGLFLFIVILPNAPYILTDIVHFYDAVRTIDSAWMITLVIVPIYAVFIGVGWFAYVLSLINVGMYLRRYQLDEYIPITELSLHLLCAIGIYIGRFVRFNSWNLVTKPQEFLSILPGELIGKFPVVVILLTFAIITILYTLCKPSIDKSSIYRG
jgi:uncharacterized membrane protein